MRKRYDFGIRNCVLEERRERERERSGEVMMRQRYIERATKQF